MDTSQDSETSESKIVFEYDKHVRYFKTHLQMLPNHYTSTDVSRMTLAFFCLGALKLLGALDKSISEQNKKEWIDWIYSQQIHPTGDGNDENQPHCGFRGSSWSGRPFDPSATHSEFIPHDTAHIASTYSALVCLLILGDDLSRVNRKAILRAIQDLQQKDGSVAPTKGSLEQDVRFIFCACAICYILNDWSALDTDKIFDYIRNIQSYEHAFGQNPNQESHGGSTFCGVATLTLLGKQEQGLLDKDKFIRWCLTRQENGFQGRPNKREDTCYCYWIGASLEMVDCFKLVDHERLRSFILSNQASIGGFVKNKDETPYPDVMHSYFGVATLSMLKEPGLEPVYTALNMPISSLEQLQSSAFWKSSSSS